MSFFGTSGATSFGRCCPSWCFCLDHWRRLSLSGVRSDTPPVVLLEVFGWRCDPVLQRRWAVFSEVILLNGRPRPWQDTAPMRVALRLWRRLLPLARSVLAELDWWTTDGDIILRRMRWSTANIPAQCRLLAGLVRVAGGWAPLPRLGRVRARGTQPPSL